MKRILRWVQVVHQCLPFSTRAVLDQFGLTGVCEAGSDPYCSSMNQSTDGSSHEHQKIPVDKHANIYWWIMRRWSADTSFFNVYTFLWWNYEQATGPWQMRPRSHRQIVVRSFSCPAYVVCASALSWMDEVLTGFFLFPLIEIIAIAGRSQHAEITATTLFPFL